MIRWDVWKRYEIEGAAAARKGLTRKDCPYPKEDDEAWNFWVYGNENEQGKMVKEYRQEHEPNYTTLWMTTAELTDYDKALLQEEYENNIAAWEALRAEKGWGDDRGGTEL